jgi:DNA polymerase I-like protein with 3'-5' exonuclease and polymerase domains
MPYQTSPTGIDGLWRGKLTDVTTLTDIDREAHPFLSSRKSIIEVVGDQKKVLEAVAYARSKGITGADAETTGRDAYVDEIILFQLGDKERQYLIWWQTIDPEPIYELMADKSVLKVGTNIKFDLKFLLAKKGKNEKGQFTGRAWNIADIQLVEQVVACGVLGFSVEHTLGITGFEDLAARWLGLSVPKDVELRTRWGDMIPGNWRVYKDGTPVPKGKKYYAADDVSLVLPILRRQKPWIVNLELVPTVNLEHSFTPVLAEMEVRGMVLDWEKWDKLAEQAQRNFIQGEKELDLLFGTKKSIRTYLDGRKEIEREYNYGSTEQLSDLIHKWMLDNYNTLVILNNKQLYNALKDTGKIPVVRLDKMFEKAIIPNPNNPNKNKRVGYPDMSDLVEKYWEDYHHLLPAGSFRVWDTESKTFKLYKIIWETPNHKIDPDLPTSMGLPPELVDPILKYRDAGTKLERYAHTWRNLKNPVTGRVHTGFTQAATNTGRLSSSPNFQNIPAQPMALDDGTMMDYREPFVAPEGYKIVGADWSQIEPRVTAQLSMSPMYMRVFWSEFPGTEGYNYWCGDSPDVKLDLYGSVGSQVGVLPQGMETKEACDASPEGKRGRKQSKIIVLGLTYGTGVEKFWITLIIDTGEHHTKEYAAKLHKDFWSAVKEVEEFMMKASNIAGPKSRRKTWHPHVGDYVAWSETIGGRKRFFHPENFNWWTEGRNHPIQGSAGGDIAKDAAVTFTHKLWEKEVDAGIVLAVHDEFLVEVADYPGLPENVLKELKATMSDSGHKYCPNVPITADGYVSVHWVKD